MEWGKGRVDRPASEHPKKREGDPWTFGELNPSGSPRGRHPSRGSLPNRPEPAMTPPAGNGADGALPIHR